MASDGATRAHRAAWTVGIFVPLALAAALVLWWPSFSEPDVAAAPEPAAVADTQRPVPPTPSRRPTVAPAVAPPPPAQEAPMPTEERTGIALFNPPGTKPTKVGIVVPEGFELPPGYVRHYQTLDDGRQLPAVLMFHPDAKPTDKDGNPVAMPEDRIVPAELAPPGLAIEYLEVPETLADEGQG